MFVILVVVEEESEEEEEQCAVTTGARGDCNAKAPQPYSEPHTKTTAGEN